MKKLLIAAIIMAVGTATMSASAAEPRDHKSSLAEARRNIGTMIANPKAIPPAIKKLTKEERKTLLNDLNKAISEMPASAEEKSAYFLNVDGTVVRVLAIELPDTPEGQQELREMLGEVFATVPPESLTVISERFAADLFDRDAEGQTKYSDAEFSRLTVETMKVINARTAETDNGSVRSCFAMLMFIRASRGLPKDLTDTLIDTLEHDDAKDMARSEWIPAALGKKTEDGKTTDVNYEPMLGSADAGRRPDIEFVLVIAGPQFHESILGDIFGKNNDQYAMVSTRTPILDAVENPLIVQKPTLGADVLGHAGAAGGTGAGATVEGIGSRGHKRPVSPIVERREEEKKKKEEPGPYTWQSRVGWRD